MVGHWTDGGGLTGCTVILCPPGTVASGQVRGGAPGTREMDLLRPGTLVEGVHAILLTGGSAFGLAAADGVMRFLEERGAGFDMGVARVPIVSAAVLFDLAVGDAAARPGPAEGYAACLAASTDVPEGNVGAGTGATVAKLNGAGGAVKGGLGTASAEEDGAIVGALAAVNAWGEVLDETGEVLASARPQAAPMEEGEPTNTTLVVVATTARLTKERAHLLSIAAHDGIAETVRPSHTARDGDTTFALATGEADTDQRTLERLAVATTAEAIRRAVRLAESVPGIPAVRDL
jgi:L-aminopeptidase/D-esterase-like protein